MIHLFTHKYMLKIFKYIFCEHFNLKSRNPHVMFISYRYTTRQISVQ